MCTSVETCWYYGTAHKLLAKQLSPPPALSGCRALRTVDRNTQMSRWAKHSWQSFQFFRLSFTPQNHAKICVLCQMRPTQWSPPFQFLMVTPPCKHLQCIESFLFVAGFWPGVLLCPVLSKQFLKFLFDSAFLQLLQIFPHQCF